MPVYFFVTADSNTDEQLLRRSFQLYIAVEQNRA